MRHYQFIRVCAALLGGLLAGCGGGGGSSTPALSTKTRALQPGDQWVYSVTGKTTNPNSAPVTLTGTLTLNLSVATEQQGGGTPLVLNGQPVLQLQSTLLATDSNHQTISSTSSTFLTQDATTGDISEVGDDGGGSSTSGSGVNTGVGGTSILGGLGGSSGSSGGGVGTPSIVRMVTPPLVIIPGSWANNLSKTGVLHYDTGDTQSYALNVTGTESVQTPIGRFSAWITNAGTGSGVTMDWAPQLGAPVRLGLQSGSAATGLLTGTALLKSTNVAH